MHAAVNSEVIGALVEADLSAGRQVRLTVNGYSNFPFLRHGKDQVQIASLMTETALITEAALITETSLMTAMPRRGDLVLVKLNDAGYLMHRVIRRNARGIWLCGDAGFRLEGPFQRAQILGRVTRVFRDTGPDGNRKRPSDSAVSVMDVGIDVNTHWYKALIWIWMLLRPVRPLFMLLNRLRVLLRRRVLKH